MADAANPYNTYKHEGLPPGPIANPGAKSLEAVMAPQGTHYFYFVARGEGRHTFSETYAAHSAAVRSVGTTDARSGTIGMRANVADARTPASVSVSSRLPGQSTISAS